MLFPMSRNPEEPVYNRIEEARTALGLSRQDLADKVGVHYQTIGYLEREEYSPSLVLQSIKTSLNLKLITHLEQCLMIPFYIAEQPY